MGFTVECFHLLCLQVVKAGGKEVVFQGWSLPKAQLAKADKAVASAVINCHVVRWKRSIVKKYMSCRRRGSAAKSPTL
jgi:hypothetical protein